MSYCLVTTRSSNGSSTEKVEIPCEDEDTTVYTNFLPDIMEVGGLTFNYCLSLKQVVGLIYHGCIIDM